jgi:RHS repeat-associated protein
MVRVAGRSTTPTTGAGDGNLATRVGLSYPWAISLGPDNTLYIADADANRVRAVRPAFTGVGSDQLSVAAEDGSTLHVFSAEGLHLRTMDAVTGATLYQFGYDAEDRLTTVTDVSGNVTTVERDGSGKPLAVVGPFGQRSELTLDSDGLLARVRNPAGEAVGLTYHPGGLLATVTDPKAAITHFSYDPNGLLVRDEDSEGGALNLARTTFEGGWQLSQTSTLGRTTTYRVERAANGSETRVNTSPAGLISRTTDGTEGKPISTAPDGTTTSFTLGPDSRFGMQSVAGNLVTTRTPSGLVSTVSSGRRTVLSDAANPLSLVSKVDSSIVNGQVFRNTYTAATRTFSALTPMQRSSTTRLDALGRLIEKAEPGITPIQYQYDSRGRLAQVSQGSRQATYTYNAQGRVSSWTDPLTRRSEYFYDAAGRLTRQLLTDGREVIRAYDVAGNLRSLTPPARPLHRFQYNSINLTTSYDPPSLGAGTWSTTYQYDLDGRLTRMTRPDGQAVALDYDGAGRTSTVTVPGGGLQYTYHGTSGNLTSVTNPYGGNVSFTYDGSLLTGTTWAGEVAGTVAVTYNTDFRITQMTVNGGSPVLFTYNADGLLGQAGALAISWDPTKAMVTGTSIGTVTTNHSYTAFGEPARRTASVSGTNVFDVTYNRDAIRRITDLTETVAGVSTTKAYTYDLAGRLSEVRENGALQAQYEYDANGNRLSATRPSGVENGTYDDQDRLLSYGMASYTYTRSGELATKTAGTETTSYEYDVLGNLRRVTLPNGKLIDYVVDGFNRRIGKKVNGVSVQGFLYEGQVRPAAELNGAGSIVSRFVYGTRVNVPDYIVKLGTTYSLVADHLGSVRLVVNTATGQVVQRLDYDEFGRVTLNTNPGFQPFGFGGGLYDDDISLVRFGARDYDPTTGRWTTKDPVGFGGADSNLMTFVGNNPISYFDPLGLWRWPDYVGVNVNVAIPNPWTGTLVGWSGTASLDRYGDWFWSPAGVEVGASATAVAGGLTVNWLNQACKPSREHLANFLSSNGFNASVGVGGGWSIRILYTR